MNPNPTLPHFENKIVKHVLSFKSFMRNQYKWQKKKLKKQVAKMS